MKKSEPQHAPSQSTLEAPRVRPLWRRRAAGALLGLITMVLATLPHWMSLRQARLLFPPAVSLYGIRPNPPRSATAARIVAAARAQIGTLYDAAYLPIAYPNGDVPAGRGACTDVVVRALRGVGVDLQLLIHHDMTARFATYPSKWGLSAPNPNIDHRRVPNQIAFFQSHGRALTQKVDQSTLTQWQPGDIVYWRSGPHRLHTGILSDQTDQQGVPLVIHNGSICVEDNCLTRWPIIGHFRFPKAISSQLLTPSKYFEGVASK